MIDYGIIALYIGGVISIIISTFGCKLNLLGSTIGYSIICIAMICIMGQSLFLLTNTPTSTNISISKIMVVIPYLIFTISIIILLIIINNHSISINNYTVSMDYYSKCTILLFILLVTFFIYKNFPTNIHILIILSLCFFGNVIIIKDILNYSTTDEVNTCYN